MADKSSQMSGAPERPLEKGRAQEKQEQRASVEDREIQKAARDVVTSANESVENSESAENVDGHIAEDEGKGKQKLGSGTAATKGDDASGATRKDEAGFPRVDVMRIQVSIQVKKEIVELKKEAKRLQNSQRFSPFHFARIIAKIRQLSILLAQLAHATAESVKQLWLKYVQ